MLRSIMSLSLALSLSAYSALAATPHFKVSVPDDSVFNQIAFQNKALGFQSGDLLACRVQNGGLLLLGGVTVWGAANQVYVVDNETIIPMRTVKSVSEGVSNFAMTDGSSVSLELGNGTGYGRGVIAFEQATLKTGRMESAQTVNCFLRTSGLE